MAPLPPGRSGLPLLGETLPFVRDPYGFVVERRRRHGNVFRSNVAGRRVAFLSGLEGAEAFYDGSNITRSDAHPFLMVDMFGGTNFEMYDGPRHLALKTIALRAFDHDAIAGYLPEMQRLVESTLARLAGRGEFRATHELRRLAIEAICSNVMGVTSPRDVEAMTRDYGTMLAGLSSTLPLKVTGTPYGRSMAARDRLLALIRGIVQARRREPGPDGLSAMLSGQAEDGRTYTDDEAVLEVHHIVVAGFIVYALMAEVMRWLAAMDELRKRCAAEVLDACPPGPLTVDALGSLSTCANVVKEAKRLTPLVPLAFGRARRTFVVGGCEVPKDWTVYLALHLCNRDPALFTQPDSFDPDRFERGEHLVHPLAFIPQGADPPTGHRCLGLDYSTFLVLAFLAVLVRQYEWELPPQDLRYDWHTRPPEPRDGIRVVLRPKR